VNEKIPQNNIIITNLVSQDSQPWLRPAKLLNIICEEADASS
jgi:hypothetical protein